MPEEPTIEQLTQERDALQAQLHDALGQRDDAIERHQTVLGQLAAKERQYGALQGQWAALQAKVTAFLNKPELVDTELSRELRQFTEEVLP